MRALGSALKIILRRPWLPGSLLLLVLLALYGGRAFLQPVTLQLGGATSEGPIHLWSLWVVAEKLWSHGPLVRFAPELAYPDGFVVHLMDPINLLLFLPGYWLGGGGVGGASLGWNLLHAGTLMLAALGCYRLARTLDASPESSAWSAAVMIAAFGGGSFLLSHPYFGRTELLPVLLMPWHLALLLAWVRGEAGWKAGLGAGLLLGGVALGGGYPATFALLLELPLCLWLLVATPGRWRVLGRLVLVALVALVVAAPSPIALLLHPPASFGSLSSPDEFAVPPLRWVELRCALRLGHPGEASLLLDQPVYPGVVLLILALLGAALRPRKALPWLLLGLWLVALSLGLYFDFGGQRRLPLLGALLTELLPFLRYIKFWGRLGVLLPLPLAAAACFAVAALLRRCSPRLRPVVGLILVATLLADQATWPRPWAERPSFEAAMPAELAPVLEGLPEGAVVQLPFELPTAEGQLIEIGFGILWQRQHGRQVTATPAEHGDQVLRASNLARAVANLQAGPSTIRVGASKAGDVGDQAAAIQDVPGESGALTQAQQNCVRADVTNLVAQGITGLVLHLERPSGPALATMIEQVLGPATVEHGTVLGWDLTAIEPLAQEPVCELFELSPVVHARLAGLRRDDRPNFLVLVVPSGVPLTDAPPPSLVARGVLFEQTFLNAPELERAIEAGITGLLPIPAPRWQVPRDPVEPAPQVLGAQGYRTAAFWGAGWGDLQQVALGFDSGLEGDPVDSLPAWARSHPGQPWLALVTLGAGEGLEAPGERAVDFLASVEGQGSLVGTVVVVVAAGPGSGQDGVHGFGDAELRSWLLFIDPILRGGRVITEPTPLVALAPTLLERAAAPIPDGLHGRSLIPQLRQNAAAIRAVRVVAVAQDALMLRTESHKLVLDSSGPALYQISTDGELRVEQGGEERGLVGRMEGQLMQLLGVRGGPADGPPQELGRQSQPDPWVDPAAGGPIGPGVGEPPRVDPLQRLTALERERDEVLAAIAELEASGSDQGSADLAAERERLRKRITSLEIRLRPLQRAREERADPQVDALGSRGSP